MCVNLSSFPPLTLKPKPRRNCTSVSMVKEKKTKKPNNKNKNKNKNAETQQNPETDERNRLKSLAHTNQLISETPAKPSSSLLPSNTLIKHHGSDIVKKSQRKTRYLFSFDGLLAPISGGKMGELTDLRSKNPILYLEFPQGRMKLLGTIVYPKNRYLTLQFSRGGRNVICEDCFDTMIVFSDGYWVGSKEENPDEARLDFPKELYEKKQSEVDFQGGAGATVMQNKVVKKAVTKPINEEPPSDSATKPINEEPPSDSATKPINEEPSSDSARDDMETDSPERQVNPKEIEYTTPVRQSGRIAGKKFKFVDDSPEDDSPESLSDASDEAAETDQNLGISTAAKVHSSEDTQLPTVQVPPPSTLSSGERKSSRSALVQPTISTLFKKAEEKNAAEDAVKIDPKKASKKIAQPNSSKSKGKSLTKKAVPEAPELPTQEKVSQVRKEGTRANRKKGKLEVVEVDDDSEESISSKTSDASEEISTPSVGDDSDDDWRS